MRNTDTVPAMLTPGEFVIRKDAADQIGPENLHMMNNIDRLSGTALLENAKSPMGYQEGGVISGLIGETAEKYSDLKSLFGKKQRFSELSDEQFEKTSDQLFDFIRNRRQAQEFISKNPEIAGPSSMKLREEEQVNLMDALSPEGGLSKSAKDYLATERVYKKSLKDLPEESVWWGSQPSRELTARGESGTATLPALDPEANLSEAAMSALGTERVYKKSLKDLPEESVWWESQVGDLGIRGEAGSEALSNLSEIGLATPVRPHVGTEEEGPDIVGDFDLATMPDPSGGIADWGEAPPIPVSDEELDVSTLNRGRKDPYKQKPSVWEWLSNILGTNRGGYTHGYQQGGEVMNYQNGGQMNDVLSVFGEKSKRGDEMQKLMAMAAMQQMQRAQQIQQAVGMQGGGYADEYQQGGTVQPPMPSPEAGPQEVPMSGGDQTYHKPAMEQLDMDQYEYQSYIKYGPDMYKWMAQNYKPKTEWTAYDSLVDAGTINPYEVSKDSLNVMTDDQMDALREKMNKPSGIDRLLRSIGMRK
jgi:hypothetical protein